MKSGDGLGLQQETEHHYLRPLSSKQYTAYGLLTQCKVKMAEYWPNFFLTSHLHRPRLVNKNLQYHITEGHYFIAGHSR